jgi:hypothetical protein
LGNFFTGNAVFHIFIDISQLLKVFCELPTGNCLLPTVYLFLPPVKQIFAQHHQQKGKCSAEDHPDKSDEEFPEAENFEIKQDKMMDEDQDQTIIDEPFDVLVL